MTKIAILTNIRSPYKTLQINEFIKIENVEINVFYTDGNNDKIKWGRNEALFKEYDLKQINFLKKINIILNRGLYNLVINNDILILSGYDQLSMIFFSLLCRIFNKPYIILIDGFSKFKIDEIENRLKFFIKKQVICNSSFIMANGKIAKEYIVKKFDYPSNKIYNQFLTVDTKTIDKLYDDKEIYRKEYREKYKIDLNKKVIIYSGRLIEIKNVKSVIYAISLIQNKSEIVLFIAGGGELEKDLLELSKNLDVNIIITGFVSDQKELFKHYYLGDVLILASIKEAWGLVVNEAMCSGLPIIVSEIAGCSDDLVVEDKNGFLIDPFDINDIKNKIEIILFNRNLDEMGQQSKNIIKEWNFENSRKELEEILNNINNDLNLNKDC